MSVLERNLMYGLSNAQAAATLAAVLVGYNIILPGGERLLNDDVLNGTVLLILCHLHSQLSDNRAGSRKGSHGRLGNRQRVVDRNGKDPYFLANPNTIEDMMNLSLVIRDTKLKDNLLALNVINDNNTTSDNLRMRSRHYLEKAAMTTTAANVSLKQLTRYDLNIASGIIHSVKENEVTSIITGLHPQGKHHRFILRNTCRKPAEGLNCEIIISKFLIPVNTIKRIVIAVPPKAEYEYGFPRWMEHFCRMGSTPRLSCTFLRERKDNRTPASMDKEEV